MSSAATIFCHICTTSHRVPDIRVFPSCGHGVCHSCMLGLVQHKTTRFPLCPECRKPFKRNEVIQLFITFSDQHTSSQSQSVGDNSLLEWRDYSDGVKTRISKVTACAGKLSCWNGRESVNRIGDELRKVVRDMKKDRGGGDVVQSLITALADFTDRILAELFTQLDVTGKKLKDREDELVKSDAQFSEALNTATKSTQLLNEANQEKENLSKEKESLSKEKEVWKKQRKALIQERDEAKRVIKQRETAIDAHKSKAEKQVAKINNLEELLENRDRELTGLYERLQEMEDASRVRHEETTDYEDDDVDGMSVIVDNSSEPDFTFDQQPSPPRPSRKPNITVAVPVPPRKPMFSSDWNLGPPSKKRRVSGEEVIADESDLNAVMFSKTLGLDKEGRPVKGSLQLGDRRRYRNL